MRKVRLKFIILFIIALILAGKSFVDIKREKAKVDSDYTDNSSLAITPSDQNTTAKEPEIFLEQTFISGNDGTEQGVATVSLKDHVYRYALSLKISDPQADNTYYAWLEKNTPKKEYIFLGRLQKNDDVYQVDYTTTEKNSGYNSIVVSEEKNDSDERNNPSKVVYSGTLSSVEYY